MIQNVEAKWDLEALYAGGASSEEFAVLLEKIDRKLLRTQAILESMEPPRTRKETSPFLEMIVEVGQLQAETSEARAYATCLTREDPADKRAAVLLQRSLQLVHRLNLVYIAVDRLLVQMPDEVLDQILSDEQVGTGTFYLQERRVQASSRLNPEMEHLMADLTGNGAKSWAQLRQKLLQRVTFTMEMGGEEKTVTGQKALQLIFSSHPDRVVRKSLPLKLRDAVAPDVELFAMAINQIMEIRGQVQRHRRWGNPLQGTLNLNRISQRSLEAMMGALDRNLVRFVPFYKKKAQLLGMEKLGEEDLLAPVGDASSLLFHYEEGLEMIAEHFGRFSPAMADFVQESVQQRWIEAEDRPGKSMIIFCTYLPVSKQPRIFTTFRGSYQCVSTLAHELGHAYHFHTLSGQSPLAQEIPTSMAEIASTFSEMLLTNSYLAGVEDGAIKTVLLNEKIKNTVLYMLKPYVHFLFEKSLVERNQRGEVLSADQLDGLLIDVQKFVYQDSLDTYAPMHWITNNLFYLTDRPFYKYQYTFGYLLSAGLYALAMEKGELSAAKYSAFLQDTGCMTVEDLAEKHLGVDLTDSAFWQRSLDLLLRDVEEFVSYT